MQLCAVCVSMCVCWMCNCVTQYKAGNCVICVFFCLSDIFTCAHTHIHTHTHTHTHTHARTHKHICYVAAEAKCHYSNSRLKQFWTTRGSCWIAIPFKPVTHSHSHRHTHKHTHTCAHMHVNPHLIPSHHAAPQNTLRQNLFIHLFIHPIILAPSLFERR